MNSSINDKELAKFNKLSKEWWEREGEFRILHQINPLRVSYIVDKIKDHFNIDGVRNIKILDVGCGGGLSCAALNKFGALVTGIDASAANILAAQEYAKKNSLEINFPNSTIESFIRTEEKFDAVICLEVIEHVNNPAEFINNLKAALKPGGVIILSTLNRTLKSRLFAIGLAEYVLRWVARGTHDYHKFLKPSEISDMAEHCGLSIKELIGMVYNPLLRVWQLDSADIDVNYFAVLTQDLPLTIDQF